MITKNNSINQQAIKTCLTAGLLDLSRLFNRKAQILDSGDKRYWEENLKWLPSQHAIDTDDLFIDFAGAVEVLRDQLTAKTKIYYNYVDLETNDIKQIVVNAKRHTLNIPLTCKIETTSFVKALDVFEDILARSSTARTFPYSIWGTEHRATYRIAFDPATEKTVYDYTNTDNGNAITFDLVLEMHYYAPVFKSHGDTELTTEKLVITEEVNLDGHIVEVSRTVDVLVYNNADIYDKNEGTITKTIHNIIVKKETDKYSY